MTTITAKWFAVVAAALALLVPVIGGALAPGYSHTADYISELGARGSAVGALVSYAGFLPTGIAAAIALLACMLRADADRSLRSSALWMLTLPLSYITAAFARCTAGCAGLDGAQALHNLAGTAEYLGGAVALAIAGSAMLRSRHKVFGISLWILAIIVAWCFLAMVDPAQGRLHGAVQRLAEAILFGFLLFLAWRRSSRLQ